jgi:hypothetical protein
MSGGYHGWQYRRPVKLQISNNSVAAPGFRIQANRGLHEATSTPLSGRAERKAPLRQISGSAREPGDSFEFCDLLAADQMEDAAKFLDTGPEPGQLFLADAVMF